MGEYPCVHGLEAIGKHEAIKYKAKIYGSLNFPFPTRY